MEPRRSAASRAIVAAAILWLLGASVVPAQAGDAGAVHAVIVGRPADPATTRLLEAASTADRTDLVVTFYDVSAPAPPAVPASVRRLLVDARGQGAAVAYVCTETQCSLPVVDPSVLRQTIQQFSVAR